MSATIIASARSSSGYEDDLFVNLEPLSPRQDPEGSDDGEWGSMKNVKSFRVPTLTPRDLVRDGRRQSLSQQFLPASPSPSSKRKNKRRLSQLVGATASGASDDGSGTIGSPRGEGSTKSGFPSSSFTAEGRLLGERVHTQEEADDRHQHQHQRTFSPSFTAFVPRVSRRGSLASVDGAGPGSAFVSFVEGDEEGEGGNNNNNRNNNNNNPHSHSSSSSSLNNKGAETAALSAAAASSPVKPSLPPGGGICIDTGSFRVDGSSSSGVRLEESHNHSNNSASFPGPAGASPGDERTPMKRQSTYRFKLADLTGGSPTKHVTPFGGGSGGGAETSLLALVQ
jgi:hypothetical protein